MRLSAPELDQARSVLTNEQGLYEFNALPAGRYSLTAFKDGYIRLAYGQTRASQPGRPLSLLEKQVLEKVDFSLPRGGAISGHLYDELGDPAVNLTVTAMKTRFGQGRRQLIPAGQATTTNDLGEYRIFGLEPGQYYVSATMRQPGAVESPGSGLAPSYFPGTTNLANAQRVAVGLGQTVASVDIPLRPEKTVSVKGVVTDAEGRSLGGASLNLIQHGPVIDHGVSATQVRPDGSFTLSGVPPGSYSIDVRSMRSSIVPLGDSGTALYPITVVGDDLVGLQISTRRMSSATGRIVFSGSAKTLGARALRVGTTPLDPTEFQWFAGIAEVTADFAFKLAVPPGQMAFKVDSLPAGWALNAVRFAGDDVTDTGIDFKPGESVNGVELELTDKISTLEGRVRDAKDQPVDDCVVLIFSQSREQWSDRRSRYFAMARPDQFGVFSVSSVASGNYYAIALEYVDQNEAADPDFLDRVQHDATRLSLHDGETKTLDLKIVVQ